MGYDETEAGMRPVAPEGAPRSSPGVARFREDVLEGLGRPRPAIPSVWFYDAEGSRLFQRIMELPGYYPTRVEREILERSAGEIVAALPGGPSAVVDLGAGDGTKTLLLVAAARLRDPGTAYAPVDISRAALRSATDRMREAWPGIGVRPVLADYAEGLRRAAAESGPAPLLALLLGSNIGNLEWEEATALLRALRGSLRPGDHLLVGFDLLKDLDVLRGAYDDPEGLTAAFNRNLLTRINRELDGDIDPDAFEHRATFDPTRPAMESWLVARRAQVAHVSGRRFPFRTGDAIHTEISWKYTEGQISELARQAGFEEVARFHDGRRWFADALWRAGPGRA
jgi:L-histidine Nalpha-methyltransferase